MTFVAELATMAASRGATLLLFGDVPRLLRDGCEAVIEPPSLGSLRTLPPYTLPPCYPEAAARRVLAPRLTPPPRSPPLNTLHTLHTLHTPFTPRSHCGVRTVCGAGVSASIPTTLVAVRRRDRVHGHGPHSARTLHCIHALFPLAPALSTASVHSSHWRMCTVHSSHWRMCTVCVAQVHGG
jgi:hypothetical protein